MSKSDTVKAMADELASKIFEFIEESEPDENEKKHRFEELACSFITAMVDFYDDKSEIEIAKEINEICLGVRNMAIVGAIKVKRGDEKRVIKKMPE